MRAIAEWSKSERRKVDPRPWYTDCFAQQRGILDAGDAWEAILCTRRAGKTHALGARRIQSLLANPKVPNLYVTLTQEHSMGNLANYLTNANKQWDLGLKWRDNKLYHPKGGYIWLAGCKDKREAEKFRGYKFSDVTIDEAGTHRDEVLRWLIYDVLSAALTDVGAPLRLSGTPGPVPTGLFWALSTGEDPETVRWPTRAWSLFDNPHHSWHRNPDLARIYRETRLRISEAHPTWVREYKGLWCLDSSVLIYYIDPALNLFDGTLPQFGMRRTTMGVDVGYDDSTAFVVCTSIWGQPKVYTRYANGDSGMKPDAIAGEIKRLVKDYGVQELYMDTGGLAKGYQAILQQDYGIPIGRAEKQEKAANIVRMQGNLQNGELVVDASRCRQLVDEANTVVWDKHRKNHREGMSDHCLDAWNYAYRPHLHQRTPPKPEESHGDRVNREMKAQALAKAQPKKKSFR